MQIRCRSLHQPLVRLRVNGTSSVGVGFIGCKLTSMTDRRHSSEAQHLLCFRLSSGVTANRGGGPVKRLRAGRHQLNHSDCLPFRLFTTQIVYLSEAVLCVYPLMLELGFLRYQCFLPAQY